MSQDCGHQHDNANALLAAFGEDTVAALADLVRSGAVVMRPNPGVAMFAVAPFPVSAQPTWAKETPE